MHRKSFQKTNLAEVTIVESPNSSERGFQVIGKVGVVFPPDFNSCFEKLM